MNLFVLFFFLGSYLSALDIPYQQNLYKTTLEGGVVVWMEENPTTDDLTSLRIIGSKDGTIVSYSLDCSTEDIEDVDLFLEQCREKIGDSLEKLTIVGVGDFSREQIQALIDHHFNSLVVQPLPIRETLSLRRLSEEESFYISLTYPTSMVFFQEVEDFKKLWSLYFFQTLVRSRLEESLKEKASQWISPREGKFLLPQNSYLGKARSTTDLTAETLSCFLFAIRTIREMGFNDQEFAAVKARVQKQLLSVNHATPESGILASYYAEWAFFNPRGCPPYAYFLESSLKILQELTLNDVHKLIRDLKDEDRLVDIAVPPLYDFQRARVEEALQQWKSDAFAVDSFKADGSSLETLTPYDHLPLDPHEAEKIYYIVDTVANTGYAGLFFSDVQQKGDEIEHIHPLKFLGTIFSNPHLKKCMRKIEDSSLKWSHFVNNIARHMKQEGKNVFPYVAGFCKAVGADPSRVNTYIQKNDWDGLLRYLVFS